jgi:hypothetical protein
MIWDVHPGSRMLILFPSRIPDPGVKRAHKTLDLGSDLGSGSATLIKRLNYGLRKLSSLLSHSREPVFLRSYPLFLRNHYRACEDQTKKGSKSKML